MTYTDLRIHGNRVTNLQTRPVKGGETKITWKYDGKRCEFVTGIQMSFDEIESWVNGLDPEDHEDMIVKPLRLKSFSGGYSADPNLMFEFNYNS